MTCRKQNLRYHEQQSAQAINISKLPSLADKERLEVPLYNFDFYGKIEIGSKKSAKEVVPIIIELINPKSIIDVGCGVGTWLSVFAEYGVQDFLGIDGDWVDKKLLHIPQSAFSFKELTRPLNIGREFDLVVSLEVAEHLPKSSAENFVDSLTSLGPVVLFSAAIPFQGGTNHVNEQWPNYWVELFSKKGCLVVDAIRQRIWQNENVESWYAQNILIFVNKSKLKEYPSLSKAYALTKTDQISIVHPNLFLLKVDPHNLSTRTVIHMLPTALKNTFKRKLKKLARKK